MRKHFTPEVVREWAETDLQNLIGKYVVVEVPASEWYKENVPDGGDWEGGQGVCEAAGFRQVVDKNSKDIEIRFIHFDDAMGWAWVPDAEVHVHVCDEHGQHLPSDPKAVKCLSTLGVRGKGVRRGEEDPRA